jgi:Protein of unknown function (DUF3298)/Deacetylase PdaC
LKVYISFLIAAAGLVGCQQGADQPLTLQRQEFTFNGVGRCDTVTNRGVSIRASYFTLPGNDPASRAITDSLQMLIVGNVTGWLDSATVAAHPAARRSLPDAARLFADDYQALMADNKFMTGCWELETKCDTVFSSRKVLTAQVSTYAYTGGAHPNAYTGYFSFDRKTGHKLRLTEMVSDTTALLRLVEGAFRKQKGLMAGQDLEAEGYFLRDGRFFLPDNVALGRAGLICHYNPYEIASYANGPIEVVIPYGQLRVKGEE